MLHRVSTWLLSQASVLFLQTKCFWDQILCSFSNRIFLGSSWPLANCSKYHTRHFFAIRISRCQLIHPAHHGNLSKCISMKREECLPPRKLKAKTYSSDKANRPWNGVGKTSLFSFLVILNYGSAIDDIMTRFVLSHSWVSFLDFEHPWTSITLGDGWTRSSLPVEHLLSMCEVPRLHV